MANKVKIIKIINTNNNANNSTPIIYYRNGYDKPFLFECEIGKIISHDIFDTHTMKYGIPYYKSFYRAVIDYNYMQNLLVVNPSVGEISCKTYDRFGKKEIHHYDSTSFERLYDIDDLLYPICVEYNKQINKCFNFLSNIFISNDTL
jgi:hypothetical protein